MRSAACDHVAQQPAQVLGAQALLDVEGGEVQPVLRRAWRSRPGGARGRRPSASAALAGSESSSRPEDEAAARRGGDPAARGGREQGPSRQAGHRYPDSARAGACESGSASASITTLSRRTWGLASAV